MPTRLTSLRRLLYRDRRRLTLASALIFAASVIGYDFVPDVDPRLPTEFFVMVALILAMPLVTLKAPRYRFAVELAAAANLVFVIVGHALPAANFNLANPNVNWISATVLYGLTILAIHLVFWGRWSDRLRRPRRMTLKAHGYSDLTPKELWFGLVPTPGHLDECPDPEVVSIDYADPGRRIVRIINWLPPSNRSETLLHIEDVAPLEFARLRMERKGPHRDRLSEGITTFRIFDEGPRRRVEIEHEMAALPPRRLLRGWLDDTLGRMMDHRLRGVERAAITAKSRKQRTATVPPADATVDVFETIKGTQPPADEDRRAEPTALRRFPARG